MFQVLILNAMPERKQSVIFEGTSKSVIFPGVEGEFEVLDFHKPIVSRLKEGVITVDNNQEIPIHGGIMAMSRQQLTVLVDL